MFHAPSQDSNLKTKGLTPCGFFAVQCFQRVEIWLPEKRGIKLSLRP
jgi:hypothetical protein